MRPGPPFRHALVTGAAGGIGSALCRLLARDGTALVLLDRDDEGLARLRHELATGVAVETHVIDLRQLDTLERLLAMIAARHPDLDLLVGNAGIDHPQAALSCDWRTVEDHFATNVSPNVVLCSVFLPRFVARRSGHVAMIASLGALGGFPHEAAYCASKAALAVLTEGLRSEYGPRGLTFTTVFPGFVDTPMLRQNAFVAPRPLPPDVAAAVIHRALRRRRPTVHFPRRTYLLLCLSRALPAALRDAIARRQMRPDFRPQAGGDAGDGGRPRPDGTA